MARIRGQKTVWQGWVYDAITLTAAVPFTTASFFTVQQGQAGKTKAETNIVTPATFTGVNAIKVKSQVLKFQDLILTANASLLQGVALTLIVNDTPVPDPIPAELIFGGATLVESVRGPAAVPEFRAVGGSGFIANAMQFAEPGLVVIDPGDTFRADFEARTSFTPSETIRVRYVLFGPRAKPAM